MPKSNELHKRKRKRFEERTNRKKKVKERKKLSKEQIKKAENRKFYVFSKFQLEIEIL